MRFSVLALDYDGTIASDGQMDSDVRSAINEVRSRGIAVVVVTGRILSGLRRVAGDLDFADAVIAENGAVLAFPDGNSRLIAQPPPPIFFEELRRCGIDFTAGQSVAYLTAAA
jgi:HAD superfamily hydrolase (TIGR01484 family)